MAYIEGAIVTHTRDKLYAVTTIHKFDVVTSGLSTERIRAHCNEYGYLYSPNQDHLEGYDARIRPLMAKDRLEFRVGLDPEAPIRPTVNGIGFGRQ